MRIREIAEVLGCSAAAVCMRMKESGMKARKPQDYPFTEKQKIAWRENGYNLAKSEGAKLARVRNGKANKGRRKRSDYDFGGHEKTRDDGYIKVYCPDHPYASSDGYVMKHRLVMEKHIGRFILPEEAVHHINRVRNDNRIENLALMTKREHAALHLKERYTERKNKKC